MSDSTSNKTAPDRTHSSDLSVRSRHERHCFIVMPFGRTVDEERWYRGWYQAVIEPAVATSGFEPILSASEDHPAAINDEIRSHLVFDPMVVVDLGGMRPEDAPNSNVMYELGIRHAFGLPLVIMAWEGQRLPFDVSNQRAIMMRRDFMEIEPARQKLIRFIMAAQQGRYYNPMESVGREAVIENTSLLLSEDSLLGALTNEVRELRNVVNARPFSNIPRIYRGLKLRNALGKSKRTSLWPIAQEIGIDNTLWSRFLTTAIPPEMQEEMHSWTLDDWANYLRAKAPELLASAEERKQSVSDDIPFAHQIPEKLVDEVTRILPAQPWPTAIHKEIAKKLNISTGAANDVIQELIRRGRFYHQIDGVLLQPVTPSAHQAD